MLVQPRYEHQLTAVLDDADKRKVIFVASMTNPLKLHNGAIVEGNGGLIQGVKQVLRPNDEWSALHESPGNIPIEDLLSSDTGMPRYRLNSILLHPTVAGEYRRAYTKKILWRVFHNLDSLADLNDTHTWHSYKRVQHVFATRIARRFYNRPDATLWVHDFQLIGVKQCLDALKIDIPTGYSHHIPWPISDTYRKLPQWKDLLEAMLRYDVVTFHTERYRDNFITCVQDSYSNVSIEPENQFTQLHAGERKVLIGAIPIGINVERFEKVARSVRTRSMAAELRRKYPGEMLIFCGGRQDITKAQHQALASFRMALRNHPDMRGNVRLLLNTAPSGGDVPLHQALELVLQSLVDEINDEFRMPTQNASGLPVWQPVVFEFTNLSQEDALAARYQACDIAMFPSYADGYLLMVAEWIACRDGKPGTLLVGKDVGIADSLSGAAIRVDPRDLGDMADALYHAWSMEPEARRATLGRMTEVISQHNISTWGKEILTAINRAYNARR